MPALPLPPLTLIHGIGGRPGHFTPLLDALGDRHDVVAPALPGHAPAAAPAVSPPDDVPTTAAWLTARVPTRGRILLGHSTGGVLALAMAVSGAVAPAGVVVVDSNVPVASDAVAARAAKAALAARPDWREAMRASLARDWAGPEPWRARVFVDLAATADEPMRSLWASVLQTDARALWAGQRTPVLYVRSTRAVDEAGVRAVVAPGVRVDVVTAGGGHWPHVESPDAVADAIRAWWRSL